MSETIKIGDVDVSVGDYISFKREDLTEHLAGEVLEWSLNTYKYAGTIRAILDNGPGMVRIVSDSGDAAWVTIRGSITVIEHRPVRKVGWYQACLHGKLERALYWDGDMWSISLGGPQSYLEDDLYVGRFIGTAG